MAWLARVQATAGNLLELLLPQSCPVCDHPGVLQPEGLCCECLKNLTPLPPSRCHCCSLPYQNSTAIGHLCERCLRRPPAFAAVFAVGLYQGSLREAIQRFKYRGRPLLDRQLGRLLAESLSKGHGETQPDLLVPVPLHPSRLRQRGFNQALLLCRELSRTSGIPMESEALRRIVATQPQQQLSAEQRWRNLCHVFAASGHFSGKQLLLVDDVLTTGATADACARVLLNAGAAAVSVAVVARAERRHS